MNMTNSLTSSYPCSRLIYASITGYGQYGPYSSRAGYDVMVEAEIDQIVGIAVGRILIEMR